MNKLYEIDREIFEAIEAEKKRQNEGIELCFVTAVFEICPAYVYSI